MLTTIKRLFHKQLPSESAAKHVELGNQHKKHGMPDLALVSYLRAIQADSENADAHAGAGSVLLQLARIREAQHHLRRAIAINPQHFEAHSNLMFAILITGDYAEGLAKYEYRLHVGPEKLRVENQKILNIFSNIPVWKGEPLEGRHLLLWTEQGLGDSIMMMRYIPLIADKCHCSVDVWCEPELVKLFQTFTSLARICSKNEPFQIQPNTVHCPLLSLPYIFKTTLETIPNKVPYLNIPIELVTNWTSRLVGHNGLKVGLVWAGNPNKDNDALRSIGFERFEPLFSIPGICFVSLQKGNAGQQACTRLLDWMSECHDLIDTAALMSNLDLIISVDTSMVHLAGALGKPVWMLNRFESEWRWLIDREDSPWYPTMRIFRQPARHDWGQPLARIGQALEALPR